jgi:hypothetical protein
VGHGHPDRKHQTLKATVAVAAALVASASTALAQYSSDPASPMSIVATSGDDAQAKIAPAPAGGQFVSYFSGPGYEKIQSWEGVEVQKVQAKIGRSLLTETAAGGGSTAITSTSTQVATDLLYRAVMVVLNSMAAQSALLTEVTKEIITLYLDNLYKKI